MLFTRYCRSAVGAFVVFDITDRSSFISAKTYLKLWQNHSNNQLACILVGTKADSWTSRQVSVDEADSFARDNNLDAYVETSAASSFNVEDAFILLLTTCYYNITIGRNRFLTPKGSESNEITSVLI